MKIRFLSTTQIKHLALLSFCYGLASSLPARGNHPPEHHLNNLTIQFRPSRDAPMPDRTSGAGSRTNFYCPQDKAFPVSSAQSQPFLAALVPQSNNGLTLSARPTFWVHLPKTAAQQAVLSVRAEDGTFHSQSFIPIPEAEGIASFELPENAPELAVNKTYQWTVVLLCGERPSPNDPAVMAWVRRVNPPASMPPSLSRSSVLRQADWYSQNGFWYDAVSSLASLRRAHSEDGAIARVWSGFLASAGLQSLSAEPVGVAQ